MNSNFERWLARETFPSDLTPISNATKRLMRMAYEAATTVAPKPNAPKPNWLHDIDEKAGMTPADKKGTCK